VSLPHLLCVDDSEAILALEKAALAGLYEVSTATSGREALEKVRKLRPDCVLLDLSMPEMDGDQVLAHVFADPELADTPIIVISSEAARAASCIDAGARAFLAKPLRAAELKATVQRVLDEQVARRRRASLAVLPVEVGPHAFALPVSSVRRVVLLPATRPLAPAPAHLSEVFELGNQPICLLDLATLLEVTNAQPLLERKVVVVEHGGERPGEELLLALAVDRVLDPEEFPAGSFSLAPSLGGTKFEPLRKALHAIVRDARGPLPVIEAAAFFTPELVAAVRELVREPGVAEASA
jgi:CheY-like chemotaxis protein